MNSFLISLLVIYQTVAFNRAAPIDLLEGNSEFVKNKEYVNNTESKILSQTSVPNGFDSTSDDKLISTTLPSLNEITNLESDSTATAENSIESFTDHFEGLEETTNPMTASTQNIESIVTTILDHDLVNSSNSKEAKNETTAEQPESSRNITNNLNVDNKQQITQQTENISKKEIIKDLKPAINISYTSIGLENFVKNLSQISNQSQTTNKNITKNYISIGIGSNLDSKTNTNSETSLKGLTSVKPANQIVTSSLDSMESFNNKIEENPQFTLFSTRENVTEKAISSQHPQNYSQIKKTTASFINQSQENLIAKEVKNQSATENSYNPISEKISDLHQAADFVTENTSKEPEHTTDTDNLKEELIQTSTSTDDIAKFFKLSNTSSIILKQPFKSISINSNLATSEENNLKKTNNHFGENSKVEQEIKNTKANQLSQANDNLEIEIFTEQPCRHEEETSSKNYKFNFVVSSTQNPAKNYGDISTTSLADQLQVLRSEQVTAPTKSAAENIGAMETYEKANEFTTKQMELEMLFDTSLRHEEMEKSTKDPELEVHRTTTSEVNTLNEILNGGSQIANEFSTQQLESLTNFNISILDEEVKTATEDLLPTIFKAKDEIKATDKKDEIREETFTIDRLYTLGDYTTTTQITREELKTSAATTENPVNTLDTMEREILKQTAKYSTTQENFITEMSTLIKSPSITTIFSREPTTLTPLTAVTNSKETVHTLSKFTHLPTENDSQVVKSSNETQQSLTDETTMIKSGNETSTMSNIEDSDHIKSQTENQLLEPLQQADILAQITESSFHVLTTILPANIETKNTSDKLITKKGLLVTTTEGDIVSSPMSNSFSKENCSRKVETTTTEYFPESTTTVLPETLMSDKFSTKLTATIQPISNLQEMVTFIDHTDSDMDITTMKHQQFEKEYEDEELAATNHIEESLTKGSFLAKQSQSANHLEQSQQQTTPGLIYSTTTANEVYETTTVTGEPVTRSLPSPPPKLEYTQNEDGVEVFYGYSLVKHN